LLGIGSSPSLASLAFGSTSVGFTSFASSAPQGALLGIGSSPSLASLAFGSTSVGFTSFASSAQ
jgi:hypothetical protein